jgi:hypothetical protein
MPGSTHTRIAPAIERITPARAQELLGSNQRNRNLRPGLVNELAAAMERGEWELNGETIKVAEDGTLIDGQHRLQAVVDSGVAIDTVIVWDLLPEAQDTIDVGRRRRLADVLAIEGYSDPAALAAALNVLHRIRTRHRLDGSRAGAPSPQQALLLLARVPTLPDSVCVARTVTKEIGGPIGVFAALHCEFRAINARAADDFFDQLAVGARLEVTDSVWHLRRRMIRANLERTYTPPSAQVAALTIKAFNFYRKRSAIEGLVFRAKDPFPEIDS